MYVKVDCSEYADLVNHEVDKNPNPWTKINLYCNAALYKWLGIQVTSDNINRTPFIKLGNRKLKVSLKSHSADNRYPEIKDKVNARPYDLYVLASFDSTDNTVFLEGFCYQNELINNKNLHKNKYYIKSYYDLHSINKLKNVSK